MLLHEHGPEVEDGPSNYPARVSTLSKKGIDTSTLGRGWSPRGQSYRALANYLSGVLYAVGASLVSQLQVLDTDESAGMYMGVPAMTIQTMVSFSSAALLAFLQVVKRQVEFSGWDGPMWNAWHLNAIRIFGRLELGAANSSS